MPLTAIVDYATLILHLSEYLVRQDLEEYYPNSIRQAEARLNSTLKNLGMQQTLILPLSGGASIPLPDGYVEWVRLTWSPGSGRTLGLVYREPNAPETTNRFRPNGPPQNYTVINERLIPIPARDGNYEFTFYRRIPSLTPTAPTNWLITTAPHIYLYAVLAELYNFVKDDDRATKMAAEAEARLVQFVGESSSGKLGRRAERAAEDAAEMQAAKAMI